MAARLGHAKTPTLDKQGFPDDVGATRQINRQLQYLNPMTDEWEFAVRLRDIRRRLLQGHQTYSIPKKHGNAQGREPLNYTSFLLQDQPYGKSRAHRNPILFQLKPVDFGVEPTGYVRYNDHIILDAYDHGIRDFGNAMPLCLSTEIEGHDIETYKRRNMKIALYDFIARMPGSYWTGKKGQTWRPKPPRPGSISMRATRFRLGAGCLTWIEKGDSDAKNAAMMGLMTSAIRTQCKITNCTRPFHDLSKAERAKCETATGKRPAKASKANRAKKAAENRGDSYDDSNDSDAAEDGEADAKEDGDQRESEDYDDTDQEEDTGSNNDEDDEVEEHAARPLPRHIVKPTTRDGVSGGFTRGDKKVKYDSSKPISKDQLPRQGRKRSKTQASSSDEAFEEAPRKLRRIGKGQVPRASIHEYEPATLRRPAMPLTSKKLQTRIQSSRADAESAIAFEDSIADAFRDPQPIANVEDTHDLGFLFDDEEQGAESDSRLQTSMALTQFPLLDETATRLSSEDSDRKGVVRNVERGSRLPKRHSKSDSAAGDEFTHPVNEERDSDAESDKERVTAPAPRKTLKRSKRSTARKGPGNTKLADAMRSTTGNNNSPQVNGPATADRKKLKQAVRRNAQKSAPYANDEQVYLQEAPSHVANAFQTSPFLDLGGGIPYPSLQEPLHPAPHVTFPDTAQIPQDFDLDGGAAFFEFPQIPLSAAPAPIAHTHEPAEDFGFDTDTFAANIPEVGEQEGINVNAEHTLSPNSGGSSEVEFDPTCDEFRSEVTAGIKAGDYRYVSPRGPKDIAAIDRVLELSRADYFQKSGHLVPQNIVEDYKGETYAFHQRRLDALFENERIEAGYCNGDSVYCLPKWICGFDKWRNVLDEQGEMLEDVTQDYDF